MNSENPGHKCNEKDEVSLHPHALTFKAQPKMEKNIKIIKVVAYPEFKILLIL